MEEAFAISFCPEGGEQMALGTCIVTSIDQAVAFVEGTPERPDFGAGGDSSQYEAKMGDEDVSYQIWEAVYKKTMTRKAALKETLKAALKAVPKETLKAALKALTTEAPKAPEPKAVPKAPEPEPEVPESEPKAAKRRRVEDEKEEEEGDSKEDGALKKHVSCFITYRELQRGGGDARLWGGCGDRNCIPTIWGNYKKLEKLAAKW